MSLAGKEYSFVIIKNPKQGRHQEPFLYFISDLNDAKAIANHYLKRWKIECCFRHLKRNGFNVEDINLKSDVKIELMMAVLVYTYVMAIMEGITKQLAKPPKLKKYKNGTSHPAISIFRNGYNEIQRIFTNVFTTINHLINLLIQIPVRDTANSVVQNV
jgi:hypothetical protein